MIARDGAGILAPQAVTEGRGRGEIVNNAGHNERPGGRARVTGPGIMIAESLSVAPEACPGQPGDSDSAARPGIYFAGPGAGTTVTAANLLIHILTLPGVGPGLAESAREFLPPRPALVAPPSMQDS